MWQTCKQLYVCMLYILYKRVNNLCIWGRWCTSECQLCSGLFLTQDFCNLQMLS